MHVESPEAERICAITNTNRKKNWSILAILEKNLYVLKKIWFIPELL